MRKIRDLLLAGSILPSFVLGQSASMAAQMPAPNMLLAQNSAAPADDPALLLLKRKGLPAKKPAGTPEPPKPASAPPPAPEPQNAPGHMKQMPPVKAPAPAPLNAPPAQMKPGLPAGHLPVAPPAQPAPAPLKPPAPAIMPAPAPLKAPAQIKPALPAGQPPVAPPTQTAPAPLKPLAPAIAPAPAPLKTPAQIKPALPAGQPPVAPPTQTAPAPLKPPAPALAPAPAPNAPAALKPSAAPTAQPPAPAPAQARQSKGITPSAAAAIGLGAGLVGGFIAGTAVRQYSDVQSQRQQVNGDGFTVYREPDRMIIQQNDNYIIRHDETRRFRDLGQNVRTVQRGNELVTIWPRPDGDQIITITDLNGRLLRRIRRLPDGREIILIDNTYSGPERSFNDEIVYLAPPPRDIPEQDYIVDARSAPEDMLYETLTAPPVAPLPRRYTLDEVRFSPDLRNRMRSVELNTINFDTASWEVSPDQIGQLASVAQALNESIRRNPNEVYLIEGYTDAVGSEVDNLSLSDRRAQSVATILTQDFGVPPENLTSQGYGKQFLKINTQEASRENRRVTIRRITPLLNGPQARQ